MTQENTDEYFFLLCVRYEVHFFGQIASMLSTHVDADADFSHVLLQDPRE